MDIDSSLLKSSPLQPLVDSLLLGSLPEYPLDILLTDPHPSDLTLALFSAKVYEQKKSVTTAAKTPSDWEMLDEPEGGWRLLTTGSNRAWNNGYSGAAYVNTALQQVVVSHRGTKLSSLGALFTDVYGICYSQYVDCINSAVTFVELIRQVIISVNTQHGRRYNLVITGHSLGGWLAQITAFTVQCLKESGGKLVKNTSGGFHAKTVVFDSPGAKPMLNKIRDEYYDRYATNILDRLDIKVYVSAPNRINICGAHLGTVYRVMINVQNFNMVERNTPLYNMSTHGINNFVNAFKERLDIYEIFDWPTNKDEFNKLFEKDDLNNGNMYHKDLGKETTKPLHKKNKRYRTASFGQTSALQSDKEVILKFYFKILSDNELNVLNQLTSIQKHQSTNGVLYKFVSDKQLKFDEGKLFFPDFEIDHANQAITCKPNNLLIEFANRLKQVMRWFETDFTELVRNQIEALPLAVDSFYRAEGQSFLDSLPKSLYNFKDSLHLQDFLLSDTARVLSVVTKDGAFEIIRLQNVLSQIKKSVNSSNPIDKYTNESHYTVINWPRLQTLINIYRSPNNQNNLMIVDGTPSTTVCSDLRYFLNKYNVQCSQHNFKKLVFISSHPLDVFNSFENIHVQDEPQINLLSLSNESQILVRTRNFISTGNQLRSFNNLLDCSIAKISQFIHSDIFKKIAFDKDYIFEIKDTRPLIHDLQMPFIKTHIVTNKEHVFNCANLLDTLVVIGGLNRRDLEPDAAWEQLDEKIILAEGDVELFFKNTCDKNQDKTIYLFEVSGDARTDIHCKKIFNRGFYVPRKFQHRLSIKLEYFTKCRLDDNIFVICSMEQKISLLGMIKECKEKKVFEKVLLIATKDQEVGIIQKYSNKNIHFVKLSERDKLNKSDDSDTFEASDESTDIDTFEASDERADSDTFEVSDERVVLEWRFSHGSVENLRPYMSTHSFEPIDEQKLSLTESNLVILTDEPGMGKTTSLASLSRHIESAWVIHIEVKQFKAHIDRLPDKLDPKEVASFILSECCTGADSALRNLACGLLENIIQSKTGSRQVVLMFDGFDEMDDYNKDKESSKDKLIKVFAFLQSKPTIQIFLTSRKYLKDSLEKKLSQFSTSFVMLTLQEQHNFLFKFWRSFLPIELGINLERLEKRLEEYAAEVVKRAKLVLGPDMDCFMGIPLQLRMLAEVFRPQSDLLIQSLEELYEKIGIASAPNLYEKFISMKYNIYIHNKTQIANVVDEDDLNEKFFEPLSKAHGELGFKTIFSDFYNTIPVTHRETITDQKLVKWSRVGLIQSLGNGEFRFIHRTYAEYYCAKMVVQWINNLPDITLKLQLIKNVLLPQILLHPDSKVIRLFMNVELGEIKPILNTQHIISRLWLEDSAVFRDHKHQTTLHIAIEEQNDHIVAFLVSELSPLKESSPEDFVSFFIQQDIRCHTALSKVNVPDSFNIGSNSSSNRIVTHIMQSIETCSHKTQEMFIFALLFMSDKSSISYFFRVREPSNFARASNRFTSVYLQIEPFMDAVRDNNVKDAKEILSELLHNNIERYCVLLLDYKHQGHILTALHLAVERGHLDVVRLLAEQTSPPLFNVLMTRYDYCKTTPLLTAVQRGHLNIVQFFTERGADINIRRRYGYTDLIFAAHKEHSLIAEFLDENGPEIKYTFNCGDTVLHSAARHGFLSVVEYLVQNGAEIKSTNSDGNTVLHNAVNGGNLSVVEYLVQNGAEIKSTNKDGSTVLHDAALGGNLYIVEYLVQNGAEIKSTNSDGNTVLHNAVYGRNLSVVEYLVQNGAEIKSTNKYGRTVLHVAAWGGKLSIVEYLVQNGAEIKSTNRDGNTVLHDAVNGGNLSVVEYLVQNGAEIKSTNKDGNTVLHSAVEGGNLSIVEYLAKNGAELKSTNSNGKTVLHTAACWGHLPIVEYLLQLGANTDRLSKWCMTPLTLASLKREWDVMRALLDWGADVNADGGLALCYAIKWGEWSIVKSLVDKQASVKESVISRNLSEFKNKFPNYEFRTE